MSGAQGNRAVDTAWARARLTRGSSSGEVWEISADYPEARLTLGADAGAGWPITAPGVQPVHCELFWDGSALWVADTQGAGGVFLDGQRVRDWAQVQGPAEIRFGQAALDVETSASKLRQMASNPKAARPVTVTDMVAPPDNSGRPSVPVFGGAAGGTALPDLEGQKTTVASLGMIPEVDDARTQIALQAPAERAPVDALKPRLGGPRLGGAGAGPAAAHRGEATKMVSMPSPPAGRPALGGPPLGAPPVGAPATGGMPAALMPRVGPGGPSAVVAPPPPGRSAPPPPPQGAGPPSPPSRPPVPPPPGHPAGLGPGDLETIDGPIDAAPIAAPAGAGAFAAPPEDAAPPPVKKSLASRLFSSKAEGVAEDSNQSLPLRTWLLLGVTVLVTVGWLLWDDTPEEEAYAGETAQVDPGATPDGETPEGATPEGETPEGTTLEGETPVVATPEGATPAGEPAQPVVNPTPAEPEEIDPDAPTLQRRAADAMAQGQLEPALALYRELAGNDPENEAYRLMVSILERRIAARGATP